MSKKLPTDSATPQRASSRGAAAALLGFDYQLDVSVLAAVQLLLVSKAADRLILEPVNDEDLEADLHDLAPGRVQPSATIAGGCKLVIQVKLKGGEPWSVEDFKKLLKHGSDKPGGRRKALHHLDDVDTRYLLVTSADAKGVLRELLVEGFEEASDKAAFPESLRATLKTSPEGRIAIWGKLAPQQLASTLREKFSDVLSVARIDQDHLLEALRREAARRMRGIAPGVWTREDLLAVIREFGGYLSSSADLDLYVPPQNFRELTGKLAKFGAVIIRGPSGTGKTEAARQLCDWARNRDGSLAVVTLGSGDTPAAARKLVNKGPMLFYIDDPWGQYSLSGGAEAWSEQLPRLLRKANAGHQFIVTSRTDMMERGKVEASLDSWTVDLDSEHYVNGQLAEIYDRRMIGLSPALQSSAYAFRKAVLEKLDTPFEVDIYFQHLQGGPAADESQPAFLQRLLALAHREAVAAIVVKTLVAEDTIGSSAMIWAVLAVRGQLDRGLLVALQRVVRGDDRQLGSALEKLVDRMVAARFLRQPARTISFAHPSAREGFEAHVKGDWLRSEEALQILVSALTRMREEDANWGMETAAGVLKLGRDFAAAIGADIPFEIDGQSQAAIDAWLDRALVAKKSDFPRLLELASEVGGNSVGGRVAHWLLKGIKRGSAWFIEDWAPPDYDDAWYDEVSGHPVAVKVADRFVREMLAFDRGSYDAGFVTKLDRIAGDLAPAYVAAAMAMVGNGFETNADTVAAGALRDVAGFDAVLHAALDDLGNDYRRWVELGRAEQRAVEDGERDEAAEEMLRWQYEGEGYTSGVFVGAYVRALRATGSWKKVAVHPRVQEMIRSWSNAVLTSPSAAGLDELRALLQVAKTHRDESDAWTAVREHWQPSLAAALEARLREQPEDAGLRDELALCALQRSPQSLSAAFDHFADEPYRQIILLSDMHCAVHRFDAKETGAAYPVILTQLPKNMAEISTALPTKNRSAGVVGEAALAALTAEAGKFDARTLSCIVPVIVASGGEASSAICHWLEVAVTRNDAASAAEAAVADDNPEPVALALRHARADARVAALRHIGVSLTAPLPPELLSFANDPSSRVRRALVFLLRDKPHPRHLYTLIGLTADTWSSAEPQYDESESFDIAREAVIALASYAPLSDEVGAELLRRADVTADRTLSQDALIVAAECCSPAIQQGIWEIVNLPVARWIRVDAFDALAGAQWVDPAIITQITATYIFAAPPILAVSAVHLLGKHAPYGDVQLIFEEIANANSCRALLLVGATALAARDEVRARRVLDLLEPDHPARQILDQGDALPPTILDNLGDVRLREIVRERLGDRIASDKKLT